MEKPTNADPSAELLARIVKAMLKSNKSLWMENRVVFVADLRSKKPVLKALDLSGKLVGIIPFDQFPDLPS